VSTGRAAALQTLYVNTPGAQDLGDKAKGILVFPNIGFLFAAQYGDRALRQGGKTMGYYRSLAASYGFQAGIESFGYILFFMDDASLQYLNNSEGWELGTGPTLVVLD
jgi:lipid-binding SYLF domain-containing protein